MNAQSLKNKFKAFETEIIVFYGEPEIIVVTETWYSDKVPHDMFGYKKYFVNRKDRENQPYGGVMCLVGNDVACEPIQSLSKLEIVWTGVCFGGALIGVYYRSHVSQVHELDLLREELKHMLDRYPKSELVLCGDFNLPNISWSEGTVGRIYRQDEYLELFSDFCLTQIVDQPTRGNIILALVFLREINSLSSVSIGAPLAGADHAVVKCKFFCDNQVKGIPKNMAYCWSKADWKKC